jgi:hypothetical protein
MEINRLNYEIYFLDFLEGNLPEHMVAGLMDFLSLNPDLQDEFTLLSEDGEISLPDEQILFQQKDTLKKKVSVYTDHNDLFETHCIASMEGDLTPAAQAGLDEFIAANPEKSFEFQAFLKTRLQPELTVTFPGKSRIRRMSVLPFTQYQTRFVFSIAASFLVIFVSYFFYQQTGNSAIPEVAVISGNHSSIQESLEEPGVNSDLLAPFEQNAVVSTTESSEENNLMEEENPALLRIANLTFAERISCSQLTITPDRIISFDSRSVKVYPAAGMEVASVNDPLTPKQYVNYLFKNRLLNQPKDEIDPNRIYAWEIADAGVRGIEKLTGREVTFNRVTESNGGVSSFELEAGRFGFSRSVSRSE